MNSPVRWIALPVIVALAAGAWLYADRPKSSDPTTTTVTTLAWEARPTDEPLRPDDVIVEQQPPGDCDALGLDPPTRLPNRELTNRQLKEFEQMMRHVAESLAVSDAPEHMHVAALLHPGPATRVELIGRALSLSPKDPFILWTAVRLCSQGRDGVACPLQDWERRLIAVDRENSEAWIRIAANRYESADRYGALAAFRRAAAAAETRTYWTETIEIVQRGLAATVSQPFPARAASAFGFSATTLPNYSDYTSMCSDMSANHVEWAYTCLAYGELLENQAKTEIGQSIGMSLQKIALEALGETEKHADLERRIENRQQERLDASAEIVATQRFIAGSPATFETYLTMLRTHGETGARAYLAKEVRAKMFAERMMRCEPATAP